MKEKILRKGNIKGLVSILMVLLYPCVFMYFQNIGEGYFVEIFGAVTIFIVLAFIIYLIAYFFLKDFFKAIFYSELAMLVLINFNTILTAIKKLLPETRKAYLFFVIALFGIILFIWLKKKKRDMEPLVTIIGIVFGCLIVFNFVTSIPSLITKVTTERQVGVSEEISDITFSEKPNVYYLFYDEYGGFENLKRYYEYDNADFENFLLEEGFNISYSSHNTESLWTSTILPNLLNLSYVASDEEYSVSNFEKTENCFLFQIFANNGYTINLINDHNQLKTAGCNVLNTGKKRESLSNYILNNSIWTEMVDLKNWIVKKVLGEKESYASSLKETLKIVENCVDEIDEGNPTLTVSYICAPHHYFALDENGLGISTEFETDYQDKWVYLGQLKYVTKSIETTVKNIKEQDPNALIMIQSDHGMRYPMWMEVYHDAGPYDKETERLYMQNVINCVYYRGETIEIEGLSGINTLRTILNHVFGTEFEMLDAIYME